MMKLRLFSFFLFLSFASTFCMDVPEKYGYSTQEESDGECVGPALIAAGLPERIAILNFDTERSVYFYQQLFVDVDRHSATSARLLKLVPQDTDQLRINLGPLKYFALRLLVDDKQVMYSPRMKEYVPAIDEKIIEDLGPIEFNYKRGVEYHKMDAARLAELIRKKNRGLEEEWLTSVDVMNFDPAARRYGYDPLFVQDEDEKDVLVLHKNAPEVINLGPLAYFAVRKDFWGYNKPPLQGEDAGRCWSRTEYDKRDKTFGSVEELIVKDANGQEVEKDYHALVFNDDTVIEFEFSANNSGDEVEASSINSGDEVDELDLSELSE